MVGLDPQSFRVIEGSGLAEDQSETPNEHVGAFLREARENTGRSVADVASTLRIRAKFLHAIEDGRYGDLPGPTYAVGFIRSYADYLGLDTAALLAQFKTESSGVEAQPELEFPVPSTVGWFPTGKVVASCAVLAAAVFGGWFYLQTKDAMDVAAVPPPPGTEPAIAVNADSEQTVDARVKVVAAAEAAQTAPPAEDGAGTTADAGTDNGLAPADQLASEMARKASSASDPQPATNAGAAVDNGEQSDPTSIPIIGSVTPGSEATEADSTPPEPVETAQTAAPPATAASTAAPAEETGPAEVVEQSGVVESTETSEPAEVTEAAEAIEPAEANEQADATRPAASTVEEVTPVTVTAALPPALPATQPPTPAAPEPVVQVATLPAIPASSGNANSSDGGRTYGVVNQEARVVIGARADSWVQVLDGNQNVVLTRMLRAGDRYLVPDRNDLVMLTGNAGGLIISVDGEQVPQIGSDGAILHNVRLDVELLKAGRAVIQ